MAVDDATAREWLARLDAMDDVDRLMTARAVLHNSLLAHLCLSNAHVHHIRDMRGQLPPHPGRCECGRCRT